MKNGGYNVFDGFEFPVFVIKGGSVLYANKALMDLAVGKYKVSEGTKGLFAALKIDGLSASALSSASPNPLSSVTYNRNGVRQQVLVISQQTKDGGHIVMLAGAEGRFKTLAEELDLYKMVFENISEPVWIFNRESYKILGFNIKAVERYGYSPAELMKMTIMDIRPQDEILVVQNAVDKTAHTKSVTHFSAIRHMKKDGSIIFVDISSACITYKGQPAMMAIATEVTEREKEREQKEFLFARHKNSLDNMTDGFALHQSVRTGKGDISDFIILEWNKAAENITGISSQSITGKYLFEAFPETAGTNTAAKFIETAAKGKTLRFESSVYPGKPSKRVFDITSYRVEGGFACIIRDITEKKKLMKRLKMKNLRLKKMNRELKSVNEMKSNILSNVSHEFRTPLSVTKGYAGMILGQKLGPVNGEQKKALQIALRNIDKLTLMIESLISYSKIQSGIDKPTCEAFSLDDMIIEVIESFREKAEVRGIKISFSPDLELIRCYADRSKIEQVFYNLMSNAIKFNREEGEITIAVRKMKRSAKVAVNDTGTGIPKKEIPSVFKKFFQGASPLAKKYAGMGMGLYISKEIIRLHGADLTVASAVGEGTTFSFSLPLAPEADL